MFTNNFQKRTLDNINEGRISVIKATAKSPNTRRKIVEKIMKLDLEI